MSTHNSVINYFKEFAARFAKEGITIQIPHPSALHLGTHYIAVDIGKSISAEFPFNKNLMNPIGSFQGGILCGLMDEVFGPLSFMAAQKPCVTINMTTHFIRPFKESDEKVIITAHVVSQSKSLLLLEATVKTKDDKLIASGTSQLLIVTDQLTRNNA
ncbi:MAG: PaaI family thioesterase [Proteobacteria bacterium]|nr:PaaI family thioesterase [Pseudomonadota bacterium]